MRSEAQKERTSGTSKELNRGAGVVMWRSADGRLSRIRMASAPNFQLRARTFPWLSHQVL
jgi:hypothetical protein